MSQIPACWSCGYGAGASHAPPPGMSPAAAAYWRAAWRWPTCRRCTAGYAAAAAAQAGDAVAAAELDEMARRPGD